MISGTTARTIILAGIAAAAFGLSGLAPPAFATVKGGSVYPVDPTVCDSVTLSVKGDLRTPCHYIIGFRVGEPEPLPTMGPVPVYRIRAVVRAREGNYEQTFCPAVLSPYEVTKQLGRLPFGRYLVEAREYIYPPALIPVNSTTPIDSSLAYFDFSVAADTCRVVDGCALLGFAKSDPAIDRLDACTARVVPGGRACFDVTLMNDAPVGAFQTMIAIPRGEAFPYDFPNLIVPVEVSATARTNGFQVAWSRDGNDPSPESSGWTKIVVYSTSGAVIQPGRGPVLHLCYDIKEGTPERSYDIEYGPTLVSTPGGEVIPLCPTFREVRGLLCVGEGGCDLDGDGVSDVRDIARLVHCVLGDSPEACPDSIRARADCNGDALVDVRDIICCVRKILARDWGWGRNYLVPAPPPGEPTSIGFEGPVTWNNSLEARATVTISRGESFGGVQFIVDPGPNGRLRGISLEDPQGASALAWEPRPNGTARVIVYGTGLTTAGSGAASAPGAGTGATRLLVTLEPAGSTAGGELMIHSFLGATTSGSVLGLQYGATQVTFPVSPVPAPVILRARPNPFIAETEITFVLPSAARASVRVFDVNGRLVRTLHDGVADAGVNRMRWNGRDDRGRTAGVGIYFVQFASGGVVQKERILRLR